MYTQCPNCDIAFKVTAEVLKQAAGMVRCGSCGHAFNSLEFLSEQMPKQPVRKETDVEIPELKPESTTADQGLPKTISAEQSAALLKTLDELAGSDIRIEDTGVEWRVLDEDEASAPAADDDDAGIEPQFETVDELLDDNPTPVDEFLTATPDIIDSPEVFAEDDDASKALFDELRFDDNTPLPDDFDLDDESAYVPQSTADQAAVVEEPADEPPSEEPQADIALSEPDEWTDILDEFEDLVTEAEAPIGFTANADPLQDDVDVDEEPPVDEGDADQPMDMDTQFALQAEAMGIDLSGIEKIDGEEDIDELEGLEDIDALDETDETFVGDGEPVADDRSNEVEDIEEVDELEDWDELEELDGLDELDEPADEQELEEPSDPEELEEEFVDDEEPVAEDSSEEPELDDVIAQLGLLDEDDDADIVEELAEEPIVVDHQIEAELAANDDPPDDEAVADHDPESSGEHYVPPQTEEEHTVNMQIDQDLMALAIEDEDGFASTIIIPDEDAESMVREEDAKDEQPASSKSGDESGFETIIMEGEFIRSALDSEKLAADAAAAAEMAELARAKEAQGNASGGKRYGMIAAAVVLVLLFAAQAIHQSREALATIPAFSNTVGQVYRALGQPVQPAWDITGWRFEATKGSTEGENGELTVYSRLGNKSDKPLPYPLIGISLTDRFEETIGSRMLDPADYLPTDLDPSRLVEPGNTFNAVITINSAAENATGFKLNVCYRVSDGQLRCAINDFK